eukprot:3348708-Lingulodinium_polyedra.AAC.1
MHIHSIRVGGRAAQQTMPCTQAKVWLVDCASSDAIDVEQVVIAGGRASNRLTNMVDHMVGVCGCAWTS